MVTSSVNSLTRPVMSRVSRILEKRGDGAHEQDEILYAFYDLSVVNPTFDVMTFLVLAELERVRVGCESFKVVIVPGPQGGFRPGGKEQNGLGVENLKWRIRNITLPCIGLMANCREVMMCHSRDEAAALRRTVVAHAFPPDYSVRFPEKYDHWLLVAEKALEGEDIPSVSNSSVALQQRVHAKQQQGPPVIVMGEQHRSRHGFSMRRSSGSTAISTS